MSKKQSKQTQRSTSQKYERRDEPMASMSSFLGRLFRAFLATLVIVSVSLAIGTVGYSYFLDMPWIDGLINASIILTGMGPVDRMESTAGKLFATFYALYSGLAFLSMVAIIIAPVYHRFLHHFHLDDE
ncbi:MAG: hypothetical protein ACK6AT_02700 [Planctomycetota bacterium]